MLVQDYQLALVPGDARATRRPDLRVVHFTHTPFCGPSSIRVLPDVRRARDLRVDGRRHRPGSTPSGGPTRSGRPRARSSGPDAAVGRTVRRARFGPDPAALAAEADAARGRGRGRALEDRVGDRQLIVRTDRIEPSKNIVRGFLAYDLLLEEHPELRERVVFVAMLNPSRETLPEYLGVPQRGRAGRGPGQRALGRPPGWEPVILDARDNYAALVAGLVRYDVLLVNPVRDGLNLVAQEGHCVNRRDGVSACRPRPARTTSSTTRAAHAPLRPRPDGGHVEPRPVDAPGRAGGHGRPAPGARRRPHDSRLVRRPGQAGRAGSSLTNCPSRFASPAGPLTTTSARSSSSGGASADRTAMRT